MNTPPDKLVLALQKGRVMQQSLDMLRQAGLDLTLSQNGRALKHDMPHATIYELRNVDVPTYVELGIADIGIVGKDVLLEAERDVYEPVDLGFACCRMSLIRAQGQTGPIHTVASKYPRVTQQYFGRLGKRVEVIKLAGNVELACLTGLADAVVDIVETGSTIRANQLEEVDTLFQSCARLIVNRAALKMKNQKLRPLITQLRALTSATQKEPISAAP